MISSGNDEKYRTFFENSLDAILITSQDGLIHSANRAACRMLGYTENEICNLGREGIVLQSEQLKIGLVERNRTGKYFGELEFIKKDSTRFPVELTSSIFIEKDGKELTSIIFRDISERKKTEKSLQESETRYRSLFENSPIGISATNLEGELLQANLPFARMYGYESVEQMKLELKNVGKLFSKPGQRVNLIKDLKENGKTDAFEFEVIKRDGSKFYVLSSGVEVKDLSGNFLYFQTSHIDLTERKRIEEELRSSSLYTRTLIEASLDPLVTINSEGKITDVNLATEKTTGLKREKLIGSEFADYFLEKNKARKGYNIVFSKGVVKDYPLTIIHKSGKTTDVLYNATLFKNENGEVQGVFAAARDITEVKKIEEELRNSKELLEKLNQHLIEVRENERNEIALNLHDDLGQKLTAINLDIAWLKSRIGVQSKAVREKIEEISSMIKETIESTKETSALLRPAMLFDLGLVSAVKFQLGSFEKQTGIKCGFNFRPEEFLLDDRISLILYRIFQESMTNIARHSGASNADVGLYKHKNKVELIIKDDGNGIELAHINSIKSLGIEGIRERVKSVNGKMSIIGAPASGTIINVELPLPKTKQ